jgi:hypothetical protein
VKRKQAEPAEPVRMLSVYMPGIGGRSTVCIGHLFLRGRSGVEAFDANTVSLGIYPDQKSAADALTIVAMGVS